MFLYIFSLGNQRIAYHRLAYYLPRPGPRLRFALLALAVAVVFLGLCALTSCLAFSRCASCAKRSLSCCLALSAAMACCRALDFLYSLPGLFPHPLRTGAPSFRRWQVRPGRHDSPRPPDSRSPSPTSPPPLHRGGHWAKVSCRYSSIP